MERDYHKPFLPGLAVAEKQRREQKKVKSRLKKQKKALDNSAQFVTHFVNVDYASVETHLMNSLVNYAPFVLFSVRQRTTEDLIKEFEVLTANHQRLMNHFK
jgi:hypothetical protein